MDRQKKIYLEMSDDGKEFKVTRTVNTLRHLVGEILRNTDVQDLVNTRQYDIVIDPNRRKKA